MAKMPIIDLTVDINPPTEKQRFFAMFDRLGVNFTDTVDAQTNTTTTTVAVDDNRHVDGVKGYTGFKLTLRFDSATGNLLDMGVWE